VHLAAVAVRDKAIKAAAQMLEAERRIGVKDVRVQSKACRRCEGRWRRSRMAIGGVPGFALRRRDARPRGVERFPHRR